jgi:hypothetical protein
MSETIHFSSFSNTSIAVDIGLIIVPYRKRVFGNHTVITIAQPSRQQ